MLILSVQRFIWIPSLHCGQNKFFIVDTGDVISTVLYRISVGQVFRNPPPPRGTPVYENVYKPEKSKNIYIYMSTYIVRRN